MISAIAIMLSILHASHPSSLFLITSQPFQQGILYLSAKKTKHREMFVRRPKAVGSEPLAVHCTRLMILAPWNTHKHRRWGGHLQEKYIGTVKLQLPFPSNTNKCRLPFALKYFLPTPLNLNNIFQVRRLTFRSLPISFEKNHPSKW